MTETIAPLGQLVIWLTDEPDAVNLIAGQYPQCPRTVVEALVHDARMHISNAARLYDDGPAALQAIYGRSGGWRYAEQKEIEENEAAERLMREFLAAQAAR